MSNEGKNNKKENLNEQTAEAFTAISFFKVGVDEDLSCLTENTVSFSDRYLARTLAVRLKKPLGSTIFSTTLHLVPAVLSYSYTTPYSRWTLSTVRLTCSFFPSMIALVLNLSITSGKKTTLIQQIQEGIFSLFK